MMSRWSRAASLLVFLALGCLAPVVVSGHGVEPSARRKLLLGGRHTFKEGDLVPLWANKVGPFSNPTETYEYYNLPFCQTKNGLKYKILGMGEVMDANRMAQTPYVLAFKKDITRDVVCSPEFGPEEIKEFRKAVQDEWYYQMFYDDLPIWGFIGKIDKVLQPPEPEVRYLLYTHMHFEIKYNGNHIIEIAASTEHPVDISEASVQGSLTLEFSYSVQWLPTNTPFDKRLERYKNFLMKPVHLEIHWFSIVNSCVMVILLLLFLVTILMRVLKNDLIKYTRDEEGMEEEESGWKYVHGDVFRFPQQKMLFCAFVGTGSQLFFLAIFIFFLALVGVFYPYNRGALYSALVVLYALTAGIAGYVGCSYHRQMEGRESWVKTVLGICFIYCGPFFLTFCFLNTVAIMYGSTAALPFGTIVVILLIWAAITIPLTIFGGIAGKNGKSDFAAPVRTNKYPREVPDLPWYRNTVPQILMAGFLPFSAIYVELYYIFATLWGHEVYIIWNILCIVFCILILVTAFITIALTYFQLAVEDHRWWWRSFLCGGSTGIYIYGYCFYYFIWRSDMSGFMQTSFYFGYMLMVSFGFFLMLGTVGWRASLSFVRHMYKSIKSE
ncbi:hypothetical protein BSKO_03862 [Bryopsis sp. KO-2023]|nr:hypothetical protein BSKO_03862 [Bryopsis sp. KO-2023]